MEEGGDEESTSDDMTVEFGSDSDEDGGTSSTTVTDGDAEGAGAGDLESVWPLPDGDASVLFAYELYEDDLVRRETATFEITGTGVATIIVFYEDLFASMGYETNQLELGESIALNVSDPAKPNLTAVVQAGPQPNGRLTLNQEKSELKTTPGGDSDGDEGSSESAADKSAESSGGGSDPALELSGTSATVNWDAVHPTFIQPDGGADPFFHIHSSNAEDGFYLSFELYTVYGAQWTGETGTFEISCADPTTSTGICVHFDPDGPGSVGDLGADFGATGTISINQLDASAYDITVSDLTFSDGTTFDQFRMVG